MAPAKPPRVRQTCIVCLTSLLASSFPAAPPTSQCTHPARTCRSCVSAWLAARLAAAPPDRLACAECAAPLAYDDVRACAPPTLFARCACLSSSSSFPRSFPFCSA